MFPWVSCTTQMLEGWRELGSKQKGRAGESYLTYHDTGIDTKDQSGLALSSHITMLLSSLEVLPQYLVHAWYKIFNQTACYFQLNMTIYFHLVCWWLKAWLVRDALFPCLIWVQNNKSFCCDYQMWFLTVKCMLRCVMICHSKFFTRGILPPLIPNRHAICLVWDIVC